jgi:molybdate transport system regulatory protein
MDENTVREAFETRLAAGDVSVTARDVELLRGIDDHGSIHAAANALERSYAHAQRRVVELEEELGPLVERRRGGSGGGGSTLTSGARELLRRFGRLDAAFSGLARVEETVLRGRVVERDGELAIVETAPGRVRALVSTEGDAVEVAIRSDAVTLTAPEDAPSPGETSARNRFPGAVESVEAGEAVARIAVDVGAGTPLFALVTRSSLERLDLEPGREVVASFKATATRATPRDLDTD